MTTANTHDSQAIEALIDPSDGSLYADSAYHSWLMLDWLRGKGIEPHINERA